jgi:hypothetical protein
VTLSPPMYASTRYMWCVSYIRTGSGGWTKTALLPVRIPNAHGVYTAIILTGIGLCCTGTASRFPSCFIGSTRTGGASWCVARAPPPWKTRHAHAVCSLAGQGCMCTHSSLYDAVCMNGLSCRRRWVHINSPARYAPYRCAVFLQGRVCLWTCRIRTIYGVHRQLVPVRCAPYSVLTGRDTCGGASGHAGTG